MKAGQQTTQDPHAREIGREQTQAHHETANSSGVFSWSASITHDSSDSSSELGSTLSGDVMFDVMLLPVQLQSAHEALPSQAAGPRTSKGRPGVSAKLWQPS